MVGKARYNKKNWCIWLIICAIYTLVMFGLVYILDYIAHRRYEKWFPSNNLATYLNVESEVTHVFGFFGFVVCVLCIIGMIFITIVSIILIINTVDDYS